MPIVDVTIGSKLPYASVHETGEPRLIPLTPKSRRFFLAMYLRYGLLQRRIGKNKMKLQMKGMGSDFWTRMFFAAMKNRGIKTHKRPFFYKAVEKYDKEGLPVWMNLIVDKIAKETNKEGSFEASYNYVLENLTKWIKEEALKMPTKIKAFIRDEMSKTGLKPDSEWSEGKSDTAFPPEKETWSTDKLLRTKTGKLFRSFGVRSKDTLTKIEVK